MMMRLRIDWQLILVGVVLSVLVGGCTPGEATPPPPAETGALYVDPETLGGEVSPYVYGSNQGTWTAVPFDMLPAAYDAKITALRWPGGNWGDRNKVQPFQVDQFMDFCEQMGAIPTVSVNLRDGTPEEAAELVRYANVEKGYDIKYWSIGNEPTLYEVELGETYDTEIFNPQWREFAEAMKAVDPDILLMGPELHQWGTNSENTLKDSAGRDWMVEFLKANGDMVDIVTVHRYPLWKPPSQYVTIDELRENTREWTPMVTYLNALIAEHTGRELPIGFTEVNTAPGGGIQREATPDSHYAAIWYADVLGQMIREGVFMVNHWMLANRTGGHGVIAGTELRPSYYVFKIYQGFGDQLVYADSGVDDLTIYAAKREDGALTLIVVNLADEAQEAQLNVQGMDAEEAEAWLLDAEHDAEGLGMQSLPGGKLAVPGQAVMLLVIVE